MRKADRLSNNPRRAAAMKAVRTALDTGARTAPVSISNTLRRRCDGERCSVTGLFALGDRWVTAREYGDLTGIDG